MNEMPPTPVPDAPPPKKKIELIRELTMADWSEIEKVLDSRKTYLGTEMNPEWLYNLKELFFKKHLEQPNFYVVGYLIDDELMAMSVFRRPSATTLCIGGTWTLALKGKKTHPRWRKSGHVKYIVQIQNHVVEACQKVGVTDVWASRPIARRGRNVEGMVLSNSVLWRQTEIEIVEAGAIPENQFAWEWVFCKSVFPQTLVVYRYELIKTEIEEHPAPTPLTVITEEPPRG